MQNRDSSGSRTVSIQSYGAASQPAEAVHPAHRRLNDYVGPGISLAFSARIAVRSYSHSARETLGGEVKKYEEKSAMSDVGSNTLEGPIIKLTGERARMHLNLLAYAACQFKPAFKGHIDAVLSQYTRETGATLNCHIPMGCGHNEDDYDDIWKVENIDDFPDIVASMGFGDFFRQEFVDRFVKKGYFSTAWSGKINEPFERAGFRDPDGWYTIYSVFPYVMLVDTRKLGGAPIPQRWSDLLHPQLQDNIVVNGSEGLVAEIPLLYFFREHGENGLIQLAANIRESRHPAQMVKSAASSNSGGAAVYIMPWFFAQARSMSSYVQLVWPEDGALTSPIYLLAKESKKAELKSVVDCITGPELGANSARSCFPSLNPHVDNKLPQGASFKWLGWDFIKSNNLEKIKTYATEVFLDSWRKKGKE
jgi:ABC-type Fe3+ transport system substrate-binding protein